MKGREARNEHIFQVRLIFQFRTSINLSKCYVRYHTKIEPLFEYKQMSNLCLNIPKLQHV